MSLSTQSIALCLEHITKSPTMIILKQHDTLWGQGDFTCFRSNSSVLFNIVGKSSSNSRRRELVDAQTGASLFELRRRYLNIKENWYIEFPACSSGSNAAGGLPYFSAAVKWKGWANFDVTFNNRAADGARTVLEVRAKNYRHLTWLVSLDGVTVVELRKIPGHEAPGQTARLRGRPAWEIDVAAGVDLSLATVVALIATELNPGNISSRSSHS